MSPAHFISLRNMSLYWTRPTKTNDTCPVKCIAALRLQKKLSYQDMLTRSEFVVLKLLTSEPDRAWPPLGTEAPAQLPTGTVLPTVITCPHTQAHAAIPWEASNGLGEPITAGLQLRCVQLKGLTSLQFILFKLVWRGKNEWLWRTSPKKWHIIQHKAAG